MSLRPSICAEKLAPSPTLEIKSIADALKKEGKTVYDFGVGEMNPEIKLPSILKTAMAEAVMCDATHYSPAAGDPELLSAISIDLQRFNLTYPPSQIVVCPGPKDAFFKVCLTIMRHSSPRNRLVAFAPVYESYQNIPILLTGQPPILLPTDHHFLPNPKQLEDLLRRDQTIALIVLNSPNNPSGAVYPLGLIQEMAGIIGQYPEVGIISDEVYRTILYDDHQHESIAAYLPDQTFVLGGMSKEISGTGLRLGFVAGPETILQTIAIVEGNVSSCVNLPTQKGYAHFLQQDTNLQLRYEIRDQLRQRRDLLLQRFRQLIDQAIWDPPSGAYYFFPDMHAYLGKKTPIGTIIQNDQDLTLYLLNSANVVTIPGSKFDCPGHLRLAYAVNPSTIEIGIQHLAEALNCLQ